jgi:hypothetical protein
MLGQVEICANIPSFQLGAKRAELRYIIRVPDTANWNNESFLNLKQI